MVPRPVRIALAVQPQHSDYPTIRRVVGEAEDLGVDMICVWDHFFPLFGTDDGWEAGRNFEAWSLLAAWAEQTSRVELAPLVSPVGFRNPDLLADMARTVDHISGGRLVLGLGGGWFERDYAEYGYPFGTAGARLGELEAAVPRIKARWSALNPPPLRDIPVLIGGGGEQRTLRLVARHADIWHCIGTPELLARKQQVLDDWCRVEGRDPSTIERSTHGGAPTSRHVPSWERSPDPYGPQLLELGFTRFTIRSGGPDFDLGPVREWVAWRDEVNRDRPVERSGP
ncbi:LLM class F420-dependent oxidoreductase [Spongisporangium articulatum]|uniref:LLM class F420-dependent oxidoreductase n=1 Tax=Spongisporangium articulatum TaxID=3362603 RepID=A0ABW8ASG1_9ACTN